MLWFVLATAQSWGLLAVMLLFFLSWCLTMFVGCPHQVKTFRSSSYIKMILMRNTVLMIVLLYVQCVCVLFPPLLPQGLRSYGLLPQGLCSPGLLPQVLRSPGPAWRAARMTVLPTSGGKRSGSASPSDAWSRPRASTGQSCVWWASTHCVWPLSIMTSLSGSPMRCVSPAQCPPCMGGNTVHYHWFPHQHQPNLSFYLFAVCTMQSIVY